MNAPAASEAAPEVGPALAVADEPRLSVEALVERWRSLSLRASTLLRDPELGSFTAAAERADKEISALVRDDSQGSLLFLIQSAGLDLQRYSVMHALLVTVVCDLAATGLPDCGDAQRRSLRLAALTMNIAMTRLQDQLALQAGELTPAQRSLTENHAERGTELLRKLGVTDELWLTAVSHHHGAPPGALAEQPVGMQLARLVQRADLFAARMSPRKVRAAMSPALAAKRTYYDENNSPDEAGSLVIKALGIYPAGSYVRLANGELAVVLRRGAAMNAPVIAGIADANGIPYVQPLLRTGGDRAAAIVKGVAPKEVHVRTPVERLLKLAR
ncbi:MAG: phosphohydrolase [Burkholderiaceae bacterium]